MIDDAAEPPIEVPRGKIVDYLLNAAHPRGGSKARFFLSFGFRPDDPDAMARALIDHLLSGMASAQVQLVDGRTRLVVTGSLPTPDGRTPRIRSVWQWEAGFAWRLVTAIPLTRARTEP